MRFLLFLVMKFLRTCAHLLLVWFSVLFSLNTMLCKLHTGHTMLPNSKYSLKCSLLQCKLIATPESHPPWPEVRPLLVRWWCAPQPMCQGEGMLIWTSCGLQSLSFFGCQFPLHSTFHVEWLQSGRATEGIPGQGSQGADRFLIAHLTTPPNKDLRLMGWSQYYLYGWKGLIGKDSSGAVVMSYHDTFDQCRTTSW